MERHDSDLVRSRDLAGLVRRMEPMVLGMAYARLGDPHAAEDAAQTVFLNAFRSLETIDDPRRVRTWFGRITLNVCTDLIRRQGREARALRTPSTPEALGRAGPDERELLRLEVRRLPEPRRSMIVLRFMQDLSYGQIADALDLPLNQVKWEIHLAFKELRARLKEVP